MAGTIALAFFAVLQPLGGMLSDRYGRKPALVFFAIGVVPLLGLIGSSFVSVLLVQCAGGIGFPYLLTVAVFGGTAPYVATWLASIGRPTWFPFYVVVLCVFGLIVYIRLPETAHRPLD